MPLLLRHPVPILLLCLSLVGTPVSYRGGASAPHLHAFVEFLMDAGSGHFDHHHGSTEHHGDEHAAEHEIGPEPGGARGAIQSSGPSVAPFVVGDVGKLAVALPTGTLEETRQMVVAASHADCSATGIDHAPVPPPPQRAASGCQLIWLSSNEGSRIVT